jgi:peroxiredoxin
MKKILILLLLISITQILSAQKGFKKCIDSVFTHVDSTSGGNFFFSGNWKNCVLGKSMPGIEFKTIAGKNFKMKNLKGKVVVLNFWFIGCEPCIKELPALNKLIQEYKNKEALFFGITYETLMTLKSDFFPKYKFDFAIVPDSKNITEMFAAGYPTTYIIDKNGIVKAAWNGGPIGEEAETEIYLKAKPVIDELLLKN